MIPKFRAWDVNSATMYEVKSIVFTLKTILGVNRQAIYPERTLDFEDTPLMQSTGLFDKNGVEIYEDDVMCCTHRVTGNVFKGVVRYDKRYGFWGVTDKRFDDLCAIPSAGAYVGYLSEIVFCEVIGNIHENPEVVEEK